MRSGGGKIQNIDLDSGNVSLIWMRQEAQLAGLCASTPDLRLRMRDLGNLHRKPLKAGWNVLQLFFLNCPKREVRADQKIHSSVLFKPPGYTARASFPPAFTPLPAPLSWDDRESLSKVTKLDQKWEKGVFDSSIAGSMLDQLEKRNQLEFVHYIAFLVQFGELKTPHHCVISLLHLP